MSKRDTELNDTGTTTDGLRGAAVKQLQSVSDRIPRLSGVGSGAVSTQSALTAGGVVIAALMGIGTAMGAVLSVAAGLLLGGAVGVTVAITDPADPVGSLIGGISTLVFLGLTGGLLTVILVADGSSTAGVVAGSVIVGFGLTCFRVAVVGTGAVARTIAWLLRVAIVTGLLAVVVAATGTDVTALVVSDNGPVGGSFAAVASPVTAATELVLVSVFGGGGIWLLTVVLPPATAVPTRQRTRYRTLRSTVRALALGVVAGGLGLAVVYLLTETVIGITTPVAPLVEAPATRVVLLRVCIVSAVIAGIVRVARSTGATLAYRQPSWILSAIVINTGFLFTSIIAGDPIATRAVASLPVGVAVGESATATVGAPAVTTVLAGVLLVAAAGGLLILPLLTGLGLIPALTAGPRLVLFGTGVAVGAYATTASSTVVVTVGIVAGLVAWDITARSARQTTDIGTEPATRAGELVHTGWSLSVGTLAVLLTVLTRTALGDGTLFEEQLLTVAALGTVTAILLTVLLWTR